MEEKKIVPCTLDKEPKKKKSFFASDAKSIGSYVFNDVILPGLRKLTYDLGSRSLHMLLFGDAGAPAQTPTGNAYWVRPSTNITQQIVQPGQPARPQVPQQTQPQQSSHWYEWEHCTFPDRASADFVLTQLTDILEEAGVVKVPAFYDLIGQTCPYTAESWGWKNLSTATIVPSANGGYTIKFPQAQPIRPGC